MTSHFFVRGAALAALTGLALSSPASASEISGAGSTFVYPVLAKWAEAYKAASGDSLNYQSIGSGGGIKQIKQQTVTFGATDKPLPAAELKKENLVQWPTIMGGIVPVVNLDGIKPGELVLDGPVLAKIYLGEIKTWDDPAIAKLNSGVKLPSAPISVVHRSDGSGTTFNFTDYLSKISADWKSKVGEETAVEWPVGIGAKGNEGVANNVQQTKNSIGYVEYAYAKQNKLTYTDLINHDGKKVAPDFASFQAAAANADWAKSPGFYVILTDQPGAQSWPITASTFILMPATPKDPAAATSALKFFAWGYAKGTDLALSLDYVPMPESVVTLVKKEWEAGIKSADGKPLQF